MGVAMRRTAARGALKCLDCGSTLTKVDYKVWGTKRFDATRDSYVEDESLGSTDMEFTCPNCSAKLEPDERLF
jgi:transcription initiation factor IIE alpha subunit